MPVKLYRRGKIWHYRGTVAKRRLRGSTGNEQGSCPANCRRTEEPALERSSRWTGIGPDICTSGHALPRRRKVRPFPSQDRGSLERTRRLKQMTAGAIRQSAVVLYPRAGPATRNRQVIVPTQAIINHAAEQELCPYIRIKRFPVTRKAKEPATWEWVQAFMAHAGTPGLAALACLMYLTGVRISKALAVRWDDVDFKKRTVLIRGTRKGDDDRFAHMPAELIAAFANIPGDRKGAVFNFKSRGNCKTQWAGACKRAGIKPLSYHACRHGFATGLLDKGVSPITVAKRGGWKDPRHVFQTYGHDVAPFDITDVRRG
jgi:integrase